MKIETLRMRRRFARVSTCPYRLHISSLFYLSIITTHVSFLYAKWCHRFRTLPRPSEGCRRSPEPRSKIFPISNAIDPLHQSAAWKDNSPLFGEQCVPLDTVCCRWTKQSVSTNCIVGVLIPLHFGKFSI